MKAKKKPAKKLYQGPRDLSKPLEASQPRTPWVSIVLVCLTLMLTTFVIGIQVGREDQKSKEAAIFAAETSYPPAVLVKPIKRSVPKRPCP